MRISYTPLTPGGPPPPSQLWNMRMKGAARSIRSTRCSRTIRSSISASPRTCRTRTHPPGRPAGHAVAHPKQNGSPAAGVRRADRRGAGRIRIYRGRDRSAEAAQGGMTIQPKKAPDVRGFLQDGSAGRNQDWRSRPPPTVKEIQRRFGIQPGPNDALLQHEVGIPACGSLTGAETRRPTQNCAGVMTLG
jgi:hypothetical protein